MTFRDDYIKRIEAEVADLRAWLKPLEAGEMQLGERKAGGQWVDTTQDSIARNKRALGIYESILTKVWADPAMFANVR
jgi:hypothetical protein